MRVCECQISLPSAIKSVLACDLLSVRNNQVAAMSVGDKVRRSATIAKVTKKMKKPFAWPKRFRCDAFRLLNANNDDLFRQRPIGAGSGFNSWRSVSRSRAHYRRASSKCIIITPTWRKSDFFKTFYFCLGYITSAVNNVWRQYRCCRRNGVLMLNRWLSIVNVCWVDFLGRCFEQTWFSLSGFLRR